MQTNASKVFSSLKKYYVHALCDGINLVALAMFQFTF